MKPVRPSKGEVVVIAKDQHEYLPLLATIGPPPEYEVTTVWELDAEELAMLMGGGCIELKLWTFGSPLQPIQLNVRQKA